MKEMKSMKKEIFMKAFTLILWFIIGTICVNAQIYHALPDSNATWIAADASSAGTFYIEQGLNPFRDDTIINSKIYNKIFIKGISDVNQYAGAFRSSPNGKAFFVPEYPIDTIEYVLYDLSANQGDTIESVAIHHDHITFDAAYDLIVDTIRYIPHGTDSLKCLYLYPLPPTPPNYVNNHIVWLEKIGCLNGGIFNTYHCGLNVMWLRCMGADDTVRYFKQQHGCYFMDSLDLPFVQGLCELPVGVSESLSESSLSVYPNPFTATTTIGIELLARSNIQFTICNSIGEKVYQFEGRYEPGIHKVIWSSSHLLAGLYYAVLRSEEGVSVVKMVKQ